MAKVRKPGLVKLIVGVLYRDPVVFARALERIETHFGPADFFSDEYAFDLTDYYEAEMGPGLTRRFLSLQTLQHHESLIRFKHMSNQWENELAVDGKRTINIDPGYLTCAKLVLASAKNFSHRIYLGRGIFAEVTMRYEGSGFTALPWTYLDYFNHKDVFEEMRGILKKQIPPDMHE